MDTPVNDVPLLEIKIKRVTTEPTFPTWGVLMFGEKPLVLTLERPFQDLHPCIPPGNYHCVRVWDRKTHGGMDIRTTFLVRGVKDRSGILFHVGNTIKDSTGCILVGESLGSEDFLGNSSTAMVLFVKALEGVNDFNLIIE